RSLPTPLELNLEGFGLHLRAQPEGLKPPHELDQRRELPLGVFRIRTLLNRPRLEDLPVRLQYVRQGLGMELKVQVSIRPRGSRRRLLQVGNKLPAQSQRRADDELVLHAGRGRHEVRHQRQLVATRLFQVPAISDLYVLERL